MAAYSYTTSQLFVPIFFFFFLSQDKPYFPHNIQSPVQRAQVLWCKWQMLCSVSCSELLIWKCSMADEYNFSLINDELCVNITWRKRLFWPSVAFSVIKLLYEHSAWCHNHLKYTIDSHYTQNYIFVHKFCKIWPEFSFLLLLQYSWTYEVYINVNV